MSGVVLVTGAAGFIGSHVCEALLARGETVAGIDNFDPYYSPAEKRANLAALQAQPGFSFLEFDVRNGEGWAPVVAGVDRIVHLAALAGVRVSVEQPLDYVAVNVDGTVRVLAAAVQAGVRQLVLASTSSVYGQGAEFPFREDLPADRPLAPYPATKRAAEMLAHSYHVAHGLNVSVLRFFSVYGPRCRPDMMPRLLAESLLHGSSVMLFAGGQMWRDWTYVSDIVAGVLGALDSPRGYEIYNLGYGTPVLMADFVAHLERLAGRKANVRSIPAPASEVVRTGADIAKAAAHFGYQPQISVEAGLKLFWDWCAAR
jgi:UDP-glucuronate 4-epimerase